LGADAGIECFLKHRNGDETGWQAKWFFELTDGQIRQLDKSISQALTKHTRLTRFIVCLPFNLRDARLGKSRSELQRWQAWSNKWKRHARRSARSISISLWDATLLIQRLTRHDPLYAGRMRYFFDHTVLDAQWFKHRFAESRANLGERYTPETNVDLPIRRTLLAFGRDPALQTEIADWFAKLEEMRYRAIQSLVQRVDEDHVRALEDETSKLARLISETPLDLDAVLPVHAWISQAERSVEVSYPCITALQERDTTGSRPEADGKLYAIDCLHRLDSLLGEFTEALHEARWQVVNDRRLLVYGDAGVGKSHLLGDTAEHWIQQEKPVILVVGSSFADADPWSQILDHVGLQGLDREVFLGALDAAGQAAGTRALLMIDAINERNGLDVWPARLAAFLQSIAHFPRVGIVLSCRSSYLPFLVESIDRTQLARIHHVGFAGHAGEAAQVYLDRRGIVRMAAPNLVPEFENPLFLKTCCDYLRKEGLNEFPRGLRGVTEIFQFYFTAVARQIERRLKLDPAQDIVGRAITALAEVGDRSERGYIPAASARAILEAILPSQGLYDRSLLSQLTSEGVLSIDPLRLPDGRSQDYVRFSFERYSDHRIAQYLLDKHLDPARPGDSFAPGTALYAYVSARDAYQKMGIIEAMAIQVPELSGAELADLVPRDPETEFILDRTFLQSVLWRNQKYFCKRTLALLEEISQRSGYDEVTRVLVAIATEPENEFNIRYLHQRLWDMPMAERDRWWSIYVAHAGDADGHPIETLISWTINNGSLQIEGTRAILMAMTLSWFLTTSHRGIRDRATKALSTLLSVRLPLAANLIRRFAAVNDPYVLDRVLAASYGAALQGQQTDGIDELALAAFEAVFAPAETPAHVLIRDHARGLVEYANARGVLPRSVDLLRVRPPYQSSWPLEEVSESTIEQYVQKRERGSFRDAIVGSTVNDGDFARYEIDSAVGHWSNLPISAAGKTQRELFEQWQTGAFRARPAAEELLRKIIAAYDQQREEEPNDPDALIAMNVEELLEDPKGNNESAGTRARQLTGDELTALETRLEEALGPEWWSEYRLYARAYIKREIYGAILENHWPETFNCIQVRRWVCKRAHDLGWTPEGFGAFDDHVRYVDRYTHNVERVGKKYQWIALHQALAHLADNVAFIGDDRETLSAFQGPWQTGTRDIDPSLLATHTFDDGWKQWGPTWWMPATTSLQHVSPAERLLWLETSEDVWTAPSLIVVTEPETEMSWFVLDESVAWHQWDRDTGELSLERRALLAVNCLLVEVGQRQNLVRSLSGRIRYGNHDLPSVSLPHSAYIGEHFWHPMYEQSDGWAEPDAFNKIPVQTQPMEAEYSAKRGEYDYSLTESFTVKLPPLGMAKKLGLRLSNGRTLSYIDRSGQVVFFDPAMTHPGPRASLIERNNFLEFLEREQLEAVWIVTSSKEVFGSKKNSGWGGERAKCSLYWLTGDGFDCKEHEERKYPSEPQLREFWGEAENMEQLPSVMLNHRRHSARPKKIRSKKVQANAGTQYAVSQRSRLKRSKTRRAKVKNR